eukprot:2923500-Ditylum_brightwellii.AAC.1
MDISNSKFPILEDQNLSVIASTTKYASINLNLDTTKHEDDSLIQCHSLSRLDNGVNEADAATTVSNKLLTKKRKQKGVVSRYMHKCDTLELTSGHIKNT